MSMRLKDWWPQITKVSIHFLDKSNYSSAKIVQCLQLWPRAHSCLADDPV